MDSVFQFFCFSVLLTELFRNMSGDISEYLRRNWKLKNWKTEKLNFPETSRKRLSIWIQVFSFSVLLTELFRNISASKHFGIFAEKLKNRKTEKLNFPERPRKKFSIWIQFFSFSVFQFCLRNYSGIFPETFRNICGETEKQKNWKTEFSREIQEEILHMDSVFQFFSFSSFSVLLTELFRNISGDISEYLRRNWKTEKLKNWIFQRDPGRDSPYGFSFSVFLFCGRIGQVELDNCIFRVSSLHVM